MLRVVEDVNATCDGHSEIINRHVPLLINRVDVSLDTNIVLVSEYDRFMGVHSRKPLHQEVLQTWSLLISTKVSCSFLWTSSVLRCLDSVLSSLFFK